MVEASSGWDLDATHVRGVHNVAAHGISRLDRDSVFCNLRSVRPDVPWQTRDLRAVGDSICSSVLASNSCVTPLRPRMDAPIMDILDHR